MDTGNVEKGVGNWENFKVLGDQKGGKHKETVPQDRDEPPSVGVITGVSGGEPHDRDPWTETLAEKKSKIATIKESRGRGKSRRRGRGKSRGRGTGKGRGRGRAGASPVSIHPMITRHDWHAKDWRRSAHSIEGIANASRCLNYKHIISGLEASDDTEDKHLYDILKNITSMEYLEMEVTNKQTNNVNSDEQKSDEQMGSAFGSSSTEELSKYFPNAQCNTTSFDTLNMDSVFPEESVLISGDESEIIEKTLEVTIVKESGDSKMLQVCTERWPENKEFTVHTDTKFQNLSTKSDGQLEYVYTLKAIVESTSQEEIELTDNLRRQKLMAIPESYSGCNKRQKKHSIRSLKTKTCNMRVDRLRRHLPDCEDENLHSDTTSSNSISVSSVASDTTTSNSISVSSVASDTTSSNIISESDTTSLSRYKQKQDTVANGTQRESFLRAKEAITESSKTESSKTRDNYSAMASTYKSGVCADKPRTKLKLKTKRQRNVIAGHTDWVSEVESGTGRDEDDESVRCVFICSSSVTFIFSCMVIQPFYSQLMNVLNSLN